MVLRRFVYYRPDMTVLPRPGASTSAARCVLVVLLLALTALVSTTVPDLATAGPVIAMAEHQDAVSDNLTGVATGAKATAWGPARGGVVAPGDVHVGHGAETIGLLCLCALLVTGIVLAVGRSWVRQVARRVIAWAGSRDGRSQERAWAVGHALRGDPLLWGISRT